MPGTDPALGPRELYLGGTIAGGFASVSIMLAVTLSNSVALAFLGGLLPIVVTVAAAYDYGDREGVESAVLPNADDAGAEQ